MNHNLRNVYDSDKSCPCSKHAPRTGHDKMARCRTSPECRARTSLPLPEPFRRSNRRTTPKSGHEQVAQRRIDHQLLFPLDQPLPPPLPRCWNPLSAACRTTWEYTLSCTLMSRCFFRSASRSCPTSTSPRLPELSLITTSSRSLVSTPQGCPFVCTMLCPGR